MLYKDGLKATLTSILLTIAAFLPLSLSSQIVIDPDMVKVVGVTYREDSVKRAMNAVATALPDTTFGNRPAAAPRRSLLDKIKRLLSEESTDRTHERPFDISFAAYPSYSHEPGFGIGGALTALYRINRKDTITVPSDMFVSVNASLRGFFQIYSKGNNIFANRRSRLNYLLELYRMPLTFRGINSKEIAVNHESRYDRYQADLQVNFTHEILEHLFLGARLRSNFTAATRMQNPEYLLGEKSSYYVTGLGLSAEYDSRDNLLSPSRGVHVLYRATFYWNALGTAPLSFFNQTVIVDAYRSLWRGAVLAVDIYGGLNSNDTPWTMREMVASDGMRMRGYYLGSYMDNCQVALQAEYRQHLYKRFGFTLWGGCATFFHSIRKNMTIEGTRTAWLPNYGVGLRFEIKQGANIRLDWGFGRNDSGIIFAFGEAF